VTQEQRKQIIVMAVLGVALMGVLVYQFTRSGDKKTSGATEATTSQTDARKTPKQSGVSGGKDDVGFVAAGVDVDALVASVEVLDFYYERERIARDPMRPLVGEMGVTLLDQTQGFDLEREIILKAMSTKVVSGIVWDPTHPCAVIDNEVVSLGQVLPLDIVVADIQPAHVVFKKGDIEVSVALKEW